MKLNQKFEEIEKAFSNKQRKLFQRLEPIIKRQAAIGLISLQGVEKTSQAEIEVIAKLISQFQPLEVVDFKESPRHIVLSGHVSRGHIVRIEPQYKVDNRNPKSQPWAIDLVLKLYRKIDQKLTHIASIGVEYDGHISHYVESKVKSTYKRDIAIVSYKGIQSLRISPEHWKSSSEDIKKAIKKYFEHQIKIIEEVQRQTIKSIPKHSLNVNVKKRIECPICNGEGMLADEHCPPCKGVGRINKELVSSLDLSEYESIDCPECKKRKNTYRSCTVCIGNGIITREKAVEIAKNRA